MLILNQGAGSSKIFHTDAEKLKRPFGPPTSENKVGLIKQGRTDLFLEQNLELHSIF